MKKIVLWLFEYSRIIVSVLCLISFSVAVICHFIYSYIPYPLIVVFWFIFGLTVGLYFVPISIKYIEKNSKATQDKFSNN